METMDPGVVFGPIANLIADPTVEEIWINSPQRIFVARSGKSELINLVLTSDAVKQLVDRTLIWSGRRLDLSQPFVDARLPDGSRLHVAIPEITAEHWAVNIRKHIMRQKSLSELAAMGVMNKGIAEELSQAVKRGSNILVSGGTQAGKTTLLKLISAIEKPSSGSIIFESQNLSSIKDKEIPILRRRFGMIFQDHKLLYDRNCFENVALPLEINNMSKADINRRVRAALDKVDLLKKEKLMPVTLSGGEQQRLAIARAIVSRPSILIAEEPTANLDKEYAEEIMNIFYSFQQVGVTVIISTHEIPSTKINKSGLKFKRFSLHERMFLKIVRMLSRTSKKPIKASSLMSLSIITPSFLSLSPPQALNSKELFCFFNSATKFAACKSPEASPEIMYIFFNYT